MKVTCIGCLHGARPQLKGGDLLIITGDLTARDKVDEYLDFYAWLDGQDYRKKILIAGNHDNELAKEAYEGRDDRFHPAIYLCDSGTEFEGLKIWGSPWTSQFPGINLKCCAFTRPFMESLKDRWDLIPDAIDILITHSPPYGFLDQIATEYGAHAGNIELRNQVMGRINPKLHVFSHIHEWGGNMVDSTITKFVNCSIMNSIYRPINKPINLEL